MQNGFTAPQRETVPEIKAAAKEQAQKARGASATSLIRAARDQIMQARVCEGNDNLRAALSVLTKAVSLVQMFMESSEFKQESQGKRGVLIKDLMNFQQVMSMCHEHYPLAHMSYLE